MLETHSITGHFNALITNEREIEIMAVIWAVKQKERAGRAPKNQKIATQHTLAHSRTESVPYLSFGYEVS